MVRKVLTFLYKETSTLHSAAYLLAFFAMLSQILAFLRDRLLAHIFGASGSLDIYYAAFRIPDFIFVTVASMVSISVLVPFIVEREKISKEAVRDLISNIFSFFALIMFATALLAFFLMPWLSEHLFKGFTAEKLAQVIFLGRILLISPIALGFSNLLGSITQAHNRFSIYAFAPILYNIGIISGIVLLGARIGVVGVAMGVALGAILHAGVQIPFVIKSGLFPRISLSFDWQSIKRVVTLSLPRTLALSTNQIAIIFLVSLASLMAAGSISIFSFALNLQSVPLSIIGVSYSLAAFPTLSRHFASNKLKDFVHQMSATARHIIFWSLPVSALFIVLRAQIVRVLLGTGQFDWNDTRLTAAALALFVLSSVFQSLLLLFMRGFYSAGKTFKPFIINLISALALVLCSYVLVKIFYLSETFRYFMTSLLDVSDLSSTAVLMLPLGYSIGTFVNCVVHWAGFEKEFCGERAEGASFSREVNRTLFQSFAASILMGAAAYFGLSIFGPHFDTGTLKGIFFQGLSAGLCGILVGVAVLDALKSRELAEVWQALRTKFWKSKVIATDPEIV